MNKDTDASRQRLTPGDSGGVASVITEPMLRIVTPDATPEEIAALVAVFSALGSGAAPTKKPRKEWASLERRLRHIPAHGHGAWKASGLPR